MSALPVIEDHIDVSAGDGHPSWTARQFPNAHFGVAPQPSPQTKGQQRNYQFTPGLRFKTVQVTPHWITGWRP